MLILKLRRGRVRVRDGVRSVVPLVRRRARKYGQVLDEKALSVKRDWMITGAHASGKSRWLGRLAGEAGAIWKNRPCVYLRAAMPLGSWGEVDAVQSWCAAQGQDWRKMRAWERHDALVAWIESTRAVLLLDDAHLLSGRKADVALRCVRGAGIVISSASAEGRVPITLRLALQQREPERIHLDSDAPYDLTAVLAFIFAVAATAAGAWPVAAAVGGLHLLGRGQRAARQS